MSLSPFTRAILAKLQKARLASGKGRAEITPAIVDAIEKRRRRLGKAVRPRPLKATSDVSPGGKWRHRDLQPSRRRTILQDRGHMAGPASMRAEWPRYSEGTQAQVTRALKKRLRRKWTGR